jgi:hypothetical protein
MNENMSIVCQNKKLKTSRSHNKIRKIYKFYKKKKVIILICLNLKISKILQHNKNIGITIIFYHFKENKLFRLHLIQINTYTTIDNF